MNNSPKVAKAKVDVFSTMTSRQIADLQVRGVISDQFIKDVNFETLTTARNDCDEDCECLMVEMTELERANKPFSTRFFRFAFQSNFVQNFSCIQQISSSRDLNIFSIYESKQKFKVTVYRQASQ